MQTYGFQAVLVRRSRDRHRADGHANKYLDRRSARLPRCLDVITYRPLKCSFRTPDMFQDLRLFVRTWHIAEQSRLSFEQPVHMQAPVRSMKSMEALIFSDKFRTSNAHVRMKFAFRSRWNAAKIRAHPCPHAFHQAVPPTPSRFEIIEATLLCAVLMLNVSLMGCVFRLQMVNGWAYAAQEVPNFHNNLES